MNAEKKHRLYKEMMDCKLEDLIHTKMNFDNALYAEFGQTPDIPEGLAWITIQEVYGLTSKLAKKYGWSITVSELVDIWKLQAAVD